MELHDSLSRGSLSRLDRAQSGDGGEPKRNTCVRVCVQLYLTALGVGEIKETLLFPKIFNNLKAVKC